MDKAKGLKRKFEISKARKALSKRDVNRKKRKSAKSVGEVLRKAGEAEEQYKLGWIISTKGGG